MTKQKVGVIAGSVLAAALLAGGGFWLGHGRFAQKTLNGTSANYAAATSNSVPLNQAPSIDSSGGLSVSSSSGGGMGQLGAGSGQNPSGNSNSSAGSSSASQAIDPSTFAQYDKYKSETQALFGDVQKGTGTELTSGKKAAVYYKGWLTNGQLFDESHPGANGQLQPFIFTLGSHQVIPGWEEGLTGMKVGGERLLVVPPSVGYGAQQQGSIPPNSVLIFDVQLLDVQ